MSHNSLYPAFIVLRYTSNNHDHVMRIPVACDQDYIPGVLPSTIQLFNGRGGIPSETTMPDAMDTFCGFLQSFLPNSASIGLAELWVYPNENADPVWITAYELGLTGTGGTVAVANSQVVFTFRSQFGGIARLYIMEGVDQINQRDPYPFPAGKLKALTDYLCSESGSWWRARDNGYLVVPITYTTKTNDQLRKKFVLDS